jgi:hypothetical protein
MPYEIPKNLKYEEKIIFNLSARQCFWLGIFILIGLIFFLKTNLSIEIKITALILLAFAGFGFAFLDFSRHSINFLSFVLSKKESGFFDKESEKFTGIKKIEDNKLILDDGSKKAIIEVFPINFKILSQKQQESVIVAYRDFLNSLDFPIQIFVRTTELSLFEYLEKTSKCASLQGNKKISDYFFEFRNFIENYNRKNSVRNRRFFIVVGEDNPTENSLDESLLEARSSLCITKLKKGGLSAKRLDENEIAKLFLAIAGNNLNSKFEKPRKITFLSSSLKS